MNIYPSLSALTSFSTLQDVSANNVANINTPEFKASRADLQTGPEDKGVYVSQIIQSSEPGPLVEKIELEQNETTNYVEQKNVLVEGSNTDLATEMVNQIINENSFAANVKSIQTYDNMVGSIINIFA
ncbi:flagellar basal-body rod protein FlgC [Desulfonauticus submarinus]|uniref:Flagellar basal-body rod protein FlgC n=1 Tax=Desulfonauticus submarinus TaxID=206665 RepID=A0A1H0CSM2_9BACT|nr:flagellar basal body rod C-terminal domain-containing protein [Desulfonauticus submarinus]SDN60869.1 flagellar basal-body rod protein FlgC [Desulfonauticus submarinus]